MNTVTLARPIEHKSATYAKLTLRRVNLGDLAAQERVEGDLGKIILMLSRLSGVPMEVIEMIDAEDLDVLSQQVAAIMGKSEGGAGSTPSS